MIADYILRHIRVNHLSAYARLPSENALARQFEVDRNTVRGALDKLRMQGRIYARQGKGFFVAPRPGRVVFPHKRELGFSEILRDTGLMYQSRLLQCNMAPATPRLAELLMVPAGEALYRIKSLRSIDRVPLAVCVSYVVMAMLPGLEAELEHFSSLNDILVNRYGFAHPVCVWLNVEAVMPGAEDMELLRIEDNIPLIKTGGVFSSPGIGPVEYYSVRARGDRFRFNIDEMGG